MTQPTPSVLAKVLADTVQADAPRLLVQTSNFAMFQDFVANKTILNRDELLKLRSTSLFGFIVGDLPVGMNRVNLEDTQSGDSIKVRQNWADIYNSLKHLSDGGLAIFNVEPAFWSNDWQTFTGELERRGFHFRAAFRFVEQTLSGTSLQPICAVFSRSSSDALFIADIDHRSSVTELVEAFCDSRFGNTISDGLEVKSTSFRGFTQLTIEHEIHAIETQYKAYRQLRMVPDLASPESISLCKKGDSFAEADNAIYIPNIGTSNVVSHLEDATLKHQNYIQVRLDPSQVLNEYLAIYFTSRLGRLSLQELAQGLVIKHIPKENIENISVPVPDLEQQRVIVNAHKALINLEVSLSRFRNELSLNPNSAATINDSVDSMLKQVNRLSKGDEIRGLVRQGESKLREFKETLTLNVKTGEKDTRMEDTVLKTIGAFMNSEGGTLLIGVADSLQIVGVNKEVDKFFKGSRDKLLLHFKNLLQRSIGEKFYPLLDYDTVEVDGQIVLHVVCRESDEPCFVNGSDFYVRANPATDKLDGQKMLDYVKRRFSK